MDVAYAERGEKAFNNKRNEQDFRTGRSARQCKCESESEKKWREVSNLCAVMNRKSTSSPLLAMLCVLISGCQPKENPVLSNEQFLGEKYPSNMLLSDSQSADVVAILVSRMLFSVFVVSAPPSATPFGTSFEKNHFRFGSSVRATSAMATRCMVQFFRGTEIACVSHLLGVSSRSILADCSRMMPEQSY